MADLEVGATKLLLVEYERLKEEQKTRIGFRDNLIYATLASMASVIAATLSLKGHANLLLLLPPASTVLGWTYLVNDEKVSAISRYIRESLRPTLARLEPARDDAVFGWEEFHRSDRRRRSRKILQLLVDLGTFCVPACGAIVVYWVNGPWRWPFMIVSLLELAVVIGLAVKVILYADLGVEARVPATGNDSTAPSVGSDS
ncbi:hypothetical protein [Micromonospora sp. S-DT3-3-22]|uniref:hypothetical protein n=1 Tax=Micromonospora sp. S-DT3-3-22 TaxID=2755359 RepID=UPI001E50FD68|nr:hypothetical protein [Micromonospora sp. S-DT3-3-22]